MRVLSKAKKINVWDYSQQKGKWSLDNSKKSSWTSDHSQMTKNDMFESTLKSTKIIHLRVLSKPKIFYVWEYSHESTLKWLKIICLRVLSNVLKLHIWEYSQKLIFMMFESTLMRVLSNTIKYPVWEYSHESTLKRIKLACLRALSWEHSQTWNESTLKHKLRVNILPSSMCSVAHEVLQLVSWRWV